MAVQPSENPTYKLHYFNIMGLAEPIRLLFAYGGIDYEDVRIEREEWPTLKPTMPMGQMPVLEVDGQRVHQSVSIGRYLAKRVGLAGENDWEDLLIDIAIDTVNDFRFKLVTAHYESDDDVKQKKLETIKADVIPFYLDKLDALAKENDGYLALGRLSYADIYLTGILHVMNYVAGFDLIENHENLKRVVENVNSVENISAWVEKRPKTDF